MQFFIRTEKINFKPSKSLSNHFQASKSSFVLKFSARNHIIAAKGGFEALKLFFSAGEASGDVHGASLAREIKKIAPATEIIGFGGNLMESAGVKLVEEFSQDFSAP